MSFDKLGLSTEILRAVAAQGYTTPTPIQEQAIPVVLQGKDLLAGAQTGTGKTAGFTLPMLHMLSATPVRRGFRPLRGLVLTPTRELAAQVGESIQTYGKNLPLRSTVIFGGVNIKPQTRALRAGQDILVATPGRLLDHARQGHLDLSKIEFFVLDEADRMLDMGFIHDIKKVLALLPPKRQNLLFSATFSREIKTLANRLLTQPACVEVARRNTAAESVDQCVHHVDRARKRELLSRIICDGGWHQVLVFTRTKHGANRLSRQLERDGITSAAIHGNKSQNARTRALASFKNGQVRALVATDIAARGLDIDKLPYVVNYELPNVPEDYVHRIGRTGRAGQDGLAISLVSDDESKLLRNIERLLKTNIPKQVHREFESTPTALAQPVSESNGDERHGRQPKQRTLTRQGRGSSRRGANRRRPAPSDHRDAAPQKSGDASQSRSRRTDAKKKTTSAQSKKSGPKPTQGNYKRSSNPGRKKSRQSRDFTWSEI